MRPIRIQRMNEAELDIAISDLEKRGFTLLSRGKDGYSFTEVKYKMSSMTPYKFRSRGVHSLCWAILNKIEVGEKT